MLKVLVTGITGFLGSHVAETLVQQGVHVIGLKRSASDTWRCVGFKERIKWIDIDDKGEWKDDLTDLKLDVIIHSAWIGVESKDRDNWSEQIKNLPFLVQLMEIARASNIRKFIFLGSQAEYGYMYGKVTEAHSVAALTAYGAVKLAALDLLKTFSELHQLHWIWLRLFAVFGERENSHWLIPSVIQKMKAEKEMDLTAGEQKYAYLYVKDFAEIVQQIVFKQVDAGVYNISSKEVQSLKAVIEIVKREVNPDFKLNFGALPYRSSQSMHIEGDISKIVNQIGPIDFTDFNVALQHTIKYYLSK